MVEQDGSEPAHHAERMPEADEHPAEHEDGKGTGAPEEQDTGDEEGRGGGEGRPQAAAREHARRHVADHARKAEGAGEDAELPVGERLRPGNLGQEGPEGADTDGVGEHHQAQQRGAAAPVHAPITDRTAGRSTRERTVACPSWAGG